PGEQLWIVRGRGCDSVQAWRHLERIFGSSDQRDAGQSDRVRCLWIWGGSGVYGGDRGACGNGMDDRDWYGAEVRPDQLRAGGGFDQQSDGELCEVRQSLWEEAIGYLFGGGRRQI